jgi:glycosyltransferase involved in cell wall biosynthesis
VKLAFVVQRYGDQIAGGSEAHCRELARRLTASHDVTVLTTCATDYVTWANRLAAGETLEHGVRVRRFLVARERRLKAFADLSDEVFSGGASIERQEAWFRENGPDTPALLEHLRMHGSDYDLVVFWAFRYAPTFFGVPLVADRAVLVPTAEEDAAIELDVLRDFFRLPRGFLFLTPEEAALVSQRAGARLEPAAVIGVGLDAPPMAADSADVVRSLSIPDRFLLYLGRVDRNKGSHTLLEYFEAYLAGGGRATLVLAGPSTLRIPDHPNIRALGYVSDHVRDALLQEAQALVIPSPYESLSIALLEGWNHGVPAIVNGRCRVLEGQVCRANGGLYYRTAREFAVALDYVLSHERERTELGSQGRAYVEREYRWPVVLARIEALFAQVAARVTQIA